MTAAKKGADAPETDQDDQTSEAVEDKGYIGLKVDPNPNEAYGLTTGPDSPSHVGGPHERAKQYATVDDPGLKHEVKEA